MSVINEQRATSLQAENDRLRERVAELEGALRPFAGVADRGKRGGGFVIAHAVYEDMTDRISAPRQSHWHWNDFARARSILNPAEGGER